MTDQETAKQSCIEDARINEAVARKLGKPIVNSEPHQLTHGHRVGMGGLCMDGCKGLVDGVGYRVPDYCHDITAAWDCIVDYGFVLRHKTPFGKWECALKDGGHVFQVEADTAPMAICLAFLKLP